MRTWLVLVLFPLMLLPARLAQAAPRGTYVEAPEGKFQRLTPAQVDYNIIYLNGCFNPGDCVLTPANNFAEEDSRTNTSIIVPSTVEMPPYPDDGTWDDVVACVRETYARFNVQIVTEDPGNVPHWENIVSGLPQYVGQPQGVGGVAPYDFQFCSIIDNGISFTFAEVYGGNVDAICWTVAQETAHAWGLDHEFLCDDPMTYLTSCGFSKSFQDVDAQCGENSPRQCRCSATQNSVQMLFDIFGPAQPSPPEVVITEPQNGAKVEPGFPVRTNINDANGIAVAELLVDGEVVSTVSIAPYVFNAPDNLGEGTHSVKVRAQDTIGSIGESAEILVTIGAGCTQDEQCDVGQVCRNGACIAGPGSPGGLGAVCTRNEDCGSGQCGSDGTNSYCTTTCNDAAPCPEDFECRSTGSGSGGVCWRADGGGGGGGGGCNTGGGTGPITALLCALAFTFLVTRRRSAA